jgi:hypothetical protein
VFEWQGETAQGPINIFYSTSSVLNQLYSTNLRIPKLLVRLCTASSTWVMHVWCTERTQSRRVDENSDGIPERYEFAVELPVLSGEELYSLRAAIFFYTIIQVCTSGIAASIDRNAAIESSEAQV